MRPGHYFGLISGPNESHGGKYPQERPDITAIQARLNSVGFKCLADGVFGPRTKAAVTDWQEKFYASSTSRYGEVWSDDWKRLFTY